MNGQRAKMLRKLTLGATSPGANRAAKKWWEWMSTAGRAHVSYLVREGQLVTLGAGWRTAFRMPTAGAAPPAPSKRTGWYGGPMGYEARRAAGFPDGF